MPRPSMVNSTTSVALQSAPIRPEWISEGTPTARNAELSRSRDGAACTLVWDCTPGKFTWHYDTDETIHILQGSVILDDGNGPSRPLGPGDVVFFPAGAVVKWHVVEHVRKLAFFRRGFPAPIAFVFNVLRRTKRLLRRPVTPQAGAEIGVAA